MTGSATLFVNASLTLAGTTTLSSGTLTIADWSGHVSAPMRSSA